MGLKDWIGDTPIAPYGPFHLRKDSIQRVTGEDAGRHTLTGVEVFLGDGEQFQKRVTATRLLAVGVFAFAIKKKRGGESFLTIQGDGFAWVLEVPAKKRGDAVKFAAKVRAQVHTLDAG